MDGLGGLAADGHDGGVGGVGAGQLHVPCELIGWDALEDELSEVGVFAFITFEGHGGEADATDPDGGGDEGEEQPRKPDGPTTRRFRCGRRRCGSAHDGYIIHMSRAHHARADFFAA